jgi:hypothetical protein
VTIDQAFAKLGLTPAEVNQALQQVPETDPEVWTKRTAVLRQVIKRRHRQVMLECHPDRNPSSEALERAKEFNALVDEMMTLQVGPRRRPQPRFVPIVRIVVTANGWSSTSTTTSTTTSYTGFGWWPGF